MSPIRRRKEDPRTHQLLAKKKILDKFKKHSRTQLIMACGTGKTLVALIVAEGGKFKTVVVFVPSLALVRQILASWSASTSWGKWGAIAVCSDPTVTDDAVYVSPEDVGCEVTTDRGRIEQFTAKTGVRVVFCTYQSAHLLAQMHFDLGVFDEAHKTAGLKTKAFSFALTDENVEISKRLFMTATPRHVRVVNDEGDEEPIFSMKDESVYGPVAHELKLRDAIEQGLICDYKIVIAALLDEVDTRGDVPAQVALVKAMKNFGCERAITFHSNVARAERFTRDEHGALAGRGKWHVNGNMPTDKREQALLAMSQEGGVVTNVRCLSEGVDFPDVDMVAFIDPKRSPIDIVQAVGRCLRIDPARRGKKRGIIFIPVYVKPGEDDEEAVRQSKFNYLYDVLQALKEQDEFLAEELRSLKSATSHGREGRVEVVGDEEIAQQFDLEKLQRTIYARLVRGLNRDSDNNKKLLLEMADRGDPRPNYWKTKLGPLLCGYINEKHNCYDPSFDREIRKRAPHWFINTVAENKKLLLEMADRGDPRPHYSTKIRAVLEKYTHIGVCYDPSFDREIRKRAPHWFINTAAENKKLLLEMADRGDPCPKNKRQSLGSYIREKHDCYDPSFDREIRKRAPHWFIDMTVENKKLLLEMAHRGDPRPKVSKTKIGKALTGYTTRRVRGGSYDPDFDREIRKRAPHWFTGANK